MSRPITLFTLLAFSVLTFSGCGPSKYNLTGGKAKKGAEVHSETQADLEDGNLTVSSLLGSVSGKMSTNTHTSTTTRILEVDNGKSTLEEVFHEKDTTAVKTVLNGKTETKEQPNALHGLTVLARRANGIWTRTLKNGQPTPEQKRSLQDTPESSTALYPDHPIVVGETWSVPAEQFKRLMGANMLTCDGSMNCTFVRLADFDGQECAVIMASLDARGSTLDNENHEIKITMNVQCTIHRSLRSYLDLKTEMRGTVKCEGERTENGQKLTVTVTGPITITETNANKP